MTRRECETKLIELAEEMYKVYKEYNPAGEHLSMSASDKVIMTSDAFFMEGNLIEDANGNIYKTVDCAKFADGCVRFMGRYVRRESA